MSNQELDKLFKNKLADHRQEPSPHAWDKVQGEINTRKKKAVWWYGGIAAAILLLFTLVLVLRSYDQKIMTDHTQVADNTPPARETPESNPEEKSKKTDHKAPGSKEQVENTKQQIAQQPAPKDMSTDAGNEPVNDRKRQADNTNKRDNPIQKSTPKNDVVPPVTKQNDVLTREQQKNIMPDATSETLVASNDQKPVERGTTLTFDITDFDLKKDVADANPDMEKQKEEPSTLKKVINFTKKMKEGNQGLEEIREAKNELFALNIKKNDNSN